MTNQVNAEDGEHDQSTDSATSPDRDDEHLADVDAGAGCTEIWEYLSERRNANGDPDPEE